MLNRLKSTKRLIEDARPWIGANRLYLYQDLFRRARTSGRSADAHIEATLGWLKAAQDASGDGGVSGRFRLKSGWTPSYPETTGYIIPTFLELERRRQDPELLARAERMVSFLLGVQLPDGAFPGGEVRPNARPIVFNTGQIILGLTRWYERTGEARALDAAVRAGRWMTSVQDPDGAFRRCTYGEKATAYHAHAAWPLARLGKVAGEKSFLEAANRHVDWLLSLADFSTGWIDLMGFFAEDHEARRGLTHTIAYTYKGLLELENILERGDAWELIRTAGEGILRRLELEGRIPGVLGCDWRGRAGYECLTGTAQLASIFMSLWRRFDDLRFLNGALKALDLVKRSQVLESPHIEINGGVAGSFPIWGEYIPLAFPNWAAKFFIDALIESKDCLAALREEPARAPYELPLAVPRAESIEVALAGAPPAAAEPPPLRIVLLSSPGSEKGYDVATALLARGIVPHAVVLDARRHGPQPIARKVIDGIRGEGPFSVVRRSLRRITPAAATRAPAPGIAVKTIENVCAAHGIPHATVDGVESPAGRKLVRSLAPDLLVLAGCGILRKGTLSIPKVGTINAHMGLLPRYRGMNVAEWAALLGGPVGCSVHFVDAGIDTGPVIAVREVDTDGAADVGALRCKVDTAQLDLLATVVQALRAGVSLPTYAQRPEDGVQFFRMHDDLKAIVNERLEQPIERA